MTITEEQRGALNKLREPFAAENVGKLPKPTRRDAQKGQCRECGGYHGLPAVHLDYVGHAVVTSRLLAVDPEWSWEPLSLDERGLPAYDGGKNLWIKLTVCGVTRLGVGDGGSAKEIIGDAIRNAAMRFGVALDLWSKEELEGDPSPGGAPAPEAAAQPSSEPDPHTGWAEPPPDDHGPPEVDDRPAPSQISQAQQKMVRGILSKLGRTERSDVQEALQQLAQRPLSSSSELSKAEASRIIDRISKLNGPDELTDVLADLPRVEQ